jgi:HPt (histidine-containing phosphotransfer) domain-containing protein
MKGNYINTEELKNITNNNNEDLLQLIDVYLTELPIQMSALQKAMKDKNYPSLSKQAHSLKSSVRILGLGEMANEIFKLELLANEEKDTNKFPEIIKEIVTNAEFALGELKSLKKQIS